MPFTFNAVMQCAWGAVGLVWLVTALRSKPSVRQQSPWSRIIHVLLVVVAFTFLFVDWTGFGILSRSVIQPSDLSRFLGSICLIGGACFAIWARLYLGGNWSANVAIKEDHSLVRSGPYAIVRHPIYSGLLLMMLGTAIEAGFVRCFVGLFIALASWHFKSRAEESFLVDRFSGDYLRYRNEVKALIPFLL